MSNVGSQALGVLAASWMRRRTSTRFTRRSKVSLDPNLDKHRTRRTAASEVPKVACSTERDALKVVSQALGVPEAHSLRM